MRSPTTLLLLAAAPACLPKAAPAPAADPPVVVAIHPATAVALDATVVIAVSAPIGRTSEEWPIEVTAPDGREVPATFEIGAGGYEIRATPIGRWPAASSLSIDLYDGFVTEDALPLALPDGPLLFETVAPDTSARPTVILRAPSGARLAPTNLRTLTLAISPREAEVGAVFLDAGTHRVPAEVAARSEAGLVVVKLPRAAFPCAPLCAGASYAARVSGPAGEMEPAPMIHTSSLADTIAPAVTSSAVRLTGHALLVRVGASEPVRLHGRAASFSTGAVELLAPLVPSAFVDLRAATPLAPGATYEVVIEGEDEAGNAIVPLAFEVTAPPAYAVEIREVVATPLHDWGGAEEGERAFDAAPGSGTVSDADEWIELVNLSPSPIDLEASGLVLRTIDGTPAETPLSRAPALLFGDGGTPGAWGPGEALVVHPRGAMAQKDLTIEIAAGDQVLDRIVLGDDPAAHHAGGRPPDLRHESLARDGFGILRWCAPTPGDPLPPVDCAK